MKDSLLEVTKWGVAHRTEQLQDFGDAVSKLVNREVKDGSIHDLGVQARKSAGWASDFAGEIAHLAKHQIAQLKK